tara:strand:+ start:2782 stop:3990 length:1209 start_codon:yes stop_codon:yes gene_type:complete
MLSIYALISLVGLIFIYLSIFSNLSKNKLIAIAVFSIFSIIWISNLGFSGNDIIAYLDNSELYSFKNPKFNGEQLEVFHGYLISTIKTFINGLDAYNLITFERFIIYWLLPSLSLFFTPTYNARKSTLVIFLTNLVLFPYTFLGATNIFSNGVATQLFLLSFVSYLNYSSEAKISSNFKYHYNKYSSILFLIFSAFTHKVGIWIICCLIFSKGAKFFLNSFALIPLEKKRLFLPRIIIYNSIPFLIIGILLKEYSSSQMFDITAPIIGIISIIFLIFLLDLIRRLFRINKLSDFKKRISKSKQFSETVFFALVFTFPALIFTIISNSDAAERIAFVSILYTSSMTLYYGIGNRNFLKVSNNVNLSNNNFTFDRSVLGCIFLLLSLTIYFYNSSAFCINYGSC